MCVYIYMHMYIGLTLAVRIPRSPPSGIGSWPRSLGSPRGSACLPWEWRRTSSRIWPRPSWSRSRAWSSGRCR